MNFNVIDHQAVKITRQISTPIMGTLLGMLAGLLVGGWCVYHFEVSGALNQVCLIAGIFMLFQLLGATIGATIGKPHSMDSQNIDLQNTDSKNTDE